MLYRYKFTFDNTISNFTIEGILTSSALLMESVMKENTYNPTDEVSIENPRAVIKINFREGTLKTNKRHFADGKFGLLHFSAGNSLIWNIIMDYMH